MPNRGGQGYYRWTLDSSSLAALVEHTNVLGYGEQLSLADTASAAFRAGVLDVAGFIDASAGLATSEYRQVVTAPLDLWTWIHLQLDSAGRHGSATRMRAVYGPVLRELRGLDTPDAEQQLLIAVLMRQLALYGKDAGLRDELRRYGLALVGVDAGVDAGVEGDVDAGVDSSESDGVDVRLLSAAVIVTLEDGPPDYVSALVETLKRSKVSTERSAILAGLARSGSRPGHLKARALTFDADVRTNEVPPLLMSITGPEWVDESWPWARQNLGRLIKHVPEAYHGMLPSLASNLCTSASIEDVAMAFEPFYDGVRGVPRSLARTLESIRLCDAVRELRLPEANEYFGL
jgi:alanyl aminopeptidase